MRLTQLRRALNVERYSVAAALAFSFAVCLALPCATSAQTKYGVFIGINDYVAFGDEPGGDLLGAERDAEFMRNVLVTLWGLEEANTRTLLSRRATKEAIRASITDFLAREAGPDDVSILYFAGHGAQAFDLDGDEPDGLDETLAPSDILKGSTENDIRDDELGAWLSTIRGRVVVILDSCHSGTATRGTGPMRARTLNREIPSEGGREPGRVRQRYDPESMADGSTTIIEIAAAGPNESAMEGPFRNAYGSEEHRGAFTYHFGRALRELSESTTYEDAVGRVITNLKADHYTQSPQLAGPKSEPLFGGARAKSIVPPNADVVRGDVITGVSRSSLSVNAVALPDGALLQALTRALDPRMPPGRPVDLLASPTPEASWPDVYLRRSEDDASFEVLGRDGGLRASVPRGQNALDGILAALDKELTTRQFVGFANPLRPFSVSLTQSRGRRTLSPSEPVVVRVESERAGYLTLADLAPSGELRLLPSEGAGILLQPGIPQEVVIAGSGSPDHGSGFGFVLALVTPTPLDAGSAGADSSATPPSLDLMTRLQDAVDGVIFREASYATWSSRLLTYEVGPA